MVGDVTMKRFQMMLDDDLDVALEERARLEGVSKAELLREFARHQLSEIPTLHRDPLWALVGADASDDDGRSVDIHDVVYPSGRAS